MEQEPRLQQGSTVCLEEREQAPMMHDAERFSVLRSSMFSQLCSERVCFSTI